MILRARKFGDFDKFDRAAAPVGSAVRRTFVATGWLVLLTIVVAVLGYSFSLRIADERQEVVRLERGNRALQGDLKLLDAELRVRMRMPQLQRWNDDVFGLVPISANQVLDSPGALVWRGERAEPAPPPALQAARPQYAVEDRAPGAAMAPPRPVTVADRAPEAGGNPPDAPAKPFLRPVRATVAPIAVSAPAAALHSAPPSSRRSAESAGIERPEEVAPVDLLRQVQLAFAPNTPIGD